jgi:UDP-N-acetylglucosamine--N-acetylmuramyl-(pentapeptide) pyrophosphoryl-undecaprenol N-acetylglucosamine transferase
MTPAAGAGAGRKAAPPGCFALLAGGGTGGHVQPALAIAEALVARGHAPASIQFVGSRRGMEGKLVPEAGFGVTLLPGRGIQRRLTADNVGAVAGLLTACVMALRVVRRRRPRVVVTVGGYAGFPASFAALLQRIPVVVVSYDAVPGAANRIIGRFAAANAVAFAGSVLPRALVTGPPVRSRILNVDRSPAGRQTAAIGLGIDPNRWLVVATGGSLGARTVNNAVVDWCAKWRDRADGAVYHVAGERNLGDVRAAAEASGLLSGEAGLDYRLVGYEPAMPDLLAAGDLVIARAGASTVAEFAAIGVPSILVPLPGSPGDHQTKNASAFQAAGAAVMVVDAECTGEKLAEAVAPLLADPSLRQAMSKAAAGLGHSDAAEQIAAIAESVARKAA